MSADLFDDPAATIEWARLVLADPDLWDRGRIILIANGLWPDGIPTETRKALRMPLDASETDGGRQ